MLNDLLNHPPATHDLRPEKPELCPGALEAVLGGAAGVVARRWRSRLGPLNRILPMVERHAATLGQKSDPELKREASLLRLELRRQGFTDALVGRAFALVREVSGRTLGKRHYNVQLLGGFALLKGMVAEMETGEGKTLAATLAAATAALAGVPVHVLTVNDYLTGRDAGEMGPVYRALGLSVGCVVHEVPVESRRRQYLSDITYCTNKEVVFDYLRDRLTLKATGTGALRLQVEHLYRTAPCGDALLLRGLHYAIADEADSLLIDEARTPLVISGSGLHREDVEVLRGVLEFARTLAEGGEFTVHPTTREVHITPAGERKLHLLELPPGTRGTAALRKGELVRRAIAALHRYQPDREYLVRNGKVHIIDTHTGRVMPDRSWDQGLQQLIEIKEGCEVSSQQETVARMSFQSFFRRYLHLAGMTGTAGEVVGELWSVYRLPVVRLPTRCPSRRTLLPDRIFYDREQRDRFLLDRVAELRRGGRPVLIGTASVAASEGVSRVLGGEGIPHAVLNAKNDAEEAAIVARAGESCAITVATNMAGRGTDIKLAAGVAEVGGLHVILTELHDAARVDRQLRGRCARQGDPGSCQTLTVLDDSVLVKAGGTASLLLRLLPAGTGLWELVAGRVLLRMQKETERLHQRLRRELLHRDVQTRGLLSLLQEQ
ncbi:prepilin peptidase [Geomonas paludis]|uniref:Protein translocase subunit SecA n=1 Tax=Geomonas paludis TaxID=2740185 RepID=A0ABY4LJ31_9BACT|nr:prepilin peptidase [Geomonas paludis]UPU38001.1 prepilin peptidase [Geomonas paludis]